MKATQLRKDIYNILDQVIETGQPISIERKGKTLKLMVDEPFDKIAKLAGKKKAKAFVGDSDDIITMDWSNEWKPKHI